MSARSCIAVALGACLAATGCDYDQQLEECAKAELCTIQGNKPVLRFPHNGFGLGSASAVTQLAWGPKRPYLSWDFDGDSNWTFRVQLNKCPPGQSLVQCPFPNEISSSKPDANGTTYQWDQDLEIGSRYWWRVRACQSTRLGHPCGPWSDPRYFDVGRPEALPNDIAGIGRAELAVGQESPMNGGGADKVYLYFGGNTGPSSWFDLFVGPPGVLTVNYRPIVAGVGDLNGDGFSDLAVGYDPHFPTGTPDQPAPAHVYLSSSAGPQISDRITLGPNDGQFGLALGRAGDVNGDGLSDLVVCQRLQKRALIYFGKPGGPANGPDGDAQLVLAGSDLVRPACAFAALADVDADGYDDIAVSASGQIRVFHGNETSGAWSDAFDVPGANVIGYGASMAGGDFNGDGHGDLVVEGNDGSAYLYLGNPQWFSGGFPAAIRFSVESGMVAPAGDVNNDGFADLAVGGRGTGKVRLYLGQATGAPRSGPVLDGNLQDFATTFAGVGDVTDDTYDDVLVGGTNGAIVFRGTPSDSDLGTLTNVLIPPTNSTNFGSSAASGY